MLIFEPIVKGEPGGLLILIEDDLGPRESTMIIGVASRAEVDKIS